MLLQLPWPEIMTGTLLGETITNLLSLDEHNDGNHIMTTRDLLNKLDDAHEDTDLDHNNKYVSGEQGAIVDALLMSTQYAGVDEQVHDFDYSVTTSRFNDDCMPNNVFYPFAYDLDIDLRDDCGTDRFTAFDHDADATTPAIQGAHLTVGGSATLNYIDATGTTLSITDESLTALLQTGSYSLSKMIKVNADTLEKHLAHYMAHLEPSCLPDFFESTVDCNDEYPDTIDGEPVFSDFDLTTCNISLQTMMMDLMPGGQYGGTDPDDLASIFNLGHALEQGLIVDDSEPISDQRTWQNPIDENGNPIDYLDENGDVSYIEVAMDDAGEYVPELRTGFIIYTIDDVTYTKPQFLANSEDFLANWEGTWANALVPYHPEFNYYNGYYRHLCNMTYASTTAVLESGGAPVPISSETYNLALQFINTYADAVSTSNLLGTSLIPTSGASHPIEDIDPYFNLAYPNAFISS